MKHTFRAGSPAPSQRGQVYSATQARCSALSPECCSWWGAGPFLPSAAASEKQGQLCAAPSLLSLVVIGVMDINTDQDCGRVMDPDMVLFSSLGLDVTIAPSGSAGHSGQHGPSGREVLKHQHDLGCHPRSQASEWPSMAAGASYINTDLGCGWARDPGMAPAATSSMVPWPWLAVHVIQICMAPAVAQLSDTNLVTGGSPDPGYLCVLWWQQAPSTSTQTQAAEGHGPRHGL